MLPNPELRSQRLETRISPETLLLVKRAAEIQGRSVSDFVVQAARDAACRTLEEVQIIRVCLEDQQAILAAMTSPPVVEPALERAMRRHAEWFPGNSLDAGH
ncbi:MAG: DUF1778 domain-containing protein [Magnetococcus sp. YQC-9]